MTYTNFIKEKIKEYDVGDPIYTKAIKQQLVLEYQLDEKKAGAMASAIIKRLKDKAVIPELRFFQKGIYYRTWTCILGELPIRKRKLAYDKYVAGDNGYETGHSFLHRMGLSTQMPARIQYASNNSKPYITEDKTLRVLVGPPKTKITQANKRYLQILDILEIYHKAPINVENPYGIILDFIKQEKLDYKILLKLAHEFYNQRVVFLLVKILIEGEKV